MGADLFHAEGKTDGRMDRRTDRQAGRQADRQTDVTKPIITFCNSVNAS